MLELEVRLAHLRPKVRSALLESMHWYEPGSSQFAMARGESQRLAEELGVSADVVRQWRWRALRQLRAAMVSCTSA